MATIKGTFKNKAGDILYPATSADKVSGLATVATSGAFADLSGKPTIPSVSGVNDGTNWTSLTINGVTKGFAAGSSGGSGGSGTSSVVAYTHTDASSGSTFTINPATVYDFGSRGLNSTERLTLNFNTSNNITGEYVLKIAAMNNPVVLDTGLSNLEITEPLASMTLKSNDEITLYNGFVYLISILDGVVSGVYVDKYHYYGDISNPMLTYAGVFTFTGVTGVDKYLINGTEISSGSNINSLLSAGLNEKNLQLRNTSDSYADQIIPLKIYKFSSTEAPTNLSVGSNNTLTWDAVTLSTGSTAYYYEVSNQNGKIETVYSTSISLSSKGFSDGDTIYVCPKYPISKGTNYYTGSYSYGPKSSITYTYTAQ